MEGVRTSPLCWLIEWWVRCDRKYLLGFSFQILAWHRLVTDLFFSFVRKSALINIQKNCKGIPLDSYPVIKITWCVLAMVEQIWQLSLITPTTTSQTRKEICTRLILVFFYQKQYNSLNTFSNHSMWRLSPTVAMLSKWWYLTRFDLFWGFFVLKGTESVTFLNAHGIHMLLFVAVFFYSAVTRVLVSRFEGH